MYSNKIDFIADLKWINENVTYFNVFSTIAGMSRAKYGLESSKHGFVFTSISQTLRSSSIIKSYP